MFLGNKNYFVDRADRGAHFWRVGLLPRLAADGRAGSQGNHLLAVHPGPLADAAVG